MTDQFKETTLKGHIQLCELRYKNLEERLDNVEARLTTLEGKISDVSKTLQSNFLEIKLAIEKANSRRDVQIIATLGTIIVASISAVAIYLK